MKASFFLGNGAFLFAECLVSVIKIMRIVLMMKSDLSTSFLPVIGECPHVLVLGTLPGKESLRKQEYYGHPRNAFWPIMFQLFGESPIANYEEKLRFIKKQKVALWDVCQRAYRPGSLDADIKMEYANAIDEMLVSNPSLKIVAFNGKKASELYDKYFERRTDLVYLTLWSTSPANAAYSLAQKLENWAQILRS